MTTGQVARGRPRPDRQRRVPADLERSLFSMIAPSRRATSAGGRRADARAGGRAGQHPDIEAAVPSRATPTEADPAAKPRTIAICQSPAARLGQPVPSSRRRPSRTPIRRRNGRAVVRGTRAALRTCRPRANLQRRSRGHRQRTRWRGSGRLPSRGSSVRRSAGRYGTAERPRSATISSGVVPMSATGILTRTVVFLRPRRTKNSSSPAAASRPSSRRGP